MGFVTKSRKKYGPTPRRRRRLAIESLEPRAMLAAQPLITEFLASNDKGLLDGNGASSDWIELFNAGDMSIDLAGWHLTDDAADLDKWAFPALPQSVLDPGEYLVVFASGNDLPDPAGNLHTSFGLSAGGDYVGLVMPDGLTVVSEFGPNGADYPEQFTDVSYGYVGSPVADEAPIQYYDADEAPGGNTAGLFGGWTPRGLGAGEGTTNFANEGGALQANGSVAELATTIGGLDPNEVYEVYAFFWDDQPGSSWNIQAGLTSGSLSDFENGSPGVIVIDSTTQVVGSAQLVSGLNVLGQGSETYDDWVDGNRVLYAAYVGKVSGSPSATLYVNHDSTLSERTWYDGVGLRPTRNLVDGVSTAHYLIPTDGNLGINWTANNFNAAANGFTSGKAAIGYDTAPPIDETSFAGEILNPQFPLGTTSVYLRTEFNLADASTITGLTLNIKYDDGFVAYLNGTPVLSQFAPANPAWNSVAEPTNRSDADSLIYQSVSLGGFLNLLEDGTNTLAFHALNRPNSTDFLLSPQLAATTGVSSFNEVRYLTTPTPGALNGPGVLGFVGDTSFSVDRGFYDAPFNVDIASSTLDADIYFTVDGSAPDPNNPTATLVNGSILIDRTRTLRAAAFKTGFEPSNIDTQTYVFLDDVFTQDPINNPQNGLSYPTSWQGGFAGDYTIDPRVVTQWNDDNSQDPEGLGIREGLMSIPTISLVLDHKDLWGTGPNGSGGIYPNATNEGDAWRRPGSVEYFDPATGETFQYNVGIQMQGSASRDNNRLLKHSFRLIFSPQFDGPGKLNFPLFDNSDFDDINTVSLKASFTDSFATRTQTNRYSPLDSTYMRDVWMRDTQIATGNLSADSTYVHLYINGLYWGLYWPSERVDDAFMASHVGGQEEDWDILRDFNELFRGERTAYDEMFSLSRQIAAASPSVANDLYHQIQGKNSNGTNDPNTDALLDVDNFIDYLITHLYAGVEDWPSHNWYAARNRVDPGDGFQFFTWDQEIALDQLYRDRTDANNVNTPGELFQNLRNSSEFRLRFADRVQKHLFNDGALTTEASQARWMQRANQIEAGIIAESARWGDAKEGEVITAYNSLGPFGDGQIPTGSQSVPLMTVNQWRESVEYVNDSFLVNAGSLLIQRLLNDSLYTDLGAPAFSINGTSQHGGTITSGSSLSMSAPGTIYFTTDGSDPRAVGGAIAGTQFTGAFPLNATTVVKARTLSGGNWSALSEATYTIGGIPLVISEINYNPYAPTTAAELAIPGVVKDDFEFIEVLNTSTTHTINLSGVQIAGGVSFTFGNLNLSPGQRALVVENVAAFQARYSAGPNVAGSWSGALNNSGEELILLDGLTNVVMSVEYGDSDPWAISADEAGATLVLIDPAGTPAEQLGKYYRWSGSAEYGGTPGGASAPLAGVVINEVLAHTDLPQVDTIELYNPTTSNIEIGGWFLSDDGANPLKFQIPAGTMLEAGQYITFDETQFDTGPSGFGLSGSEGETLFLVVSNGAGGVLAFVDQVQFGGSFYGESFGRVPDGNGRFAPLVTPTLGAPNSGPRVGPLVISEVNYHPTDPSPAALAVDPILTDNDLEFIEIFNPTADTVNLSDWRIRGRADYDFSPGTMLPSGETLIVVTFNPADGATASRLAAFRTHYGIGAGVALVGALDNNLDNGVARVTLEGPDDPSPGNPNFIPHVLVDEVLYDDLTPWPMSADGGGASLERVGPTTYGNVAASWLGSAPTPGSGNFTPILAGDYNRDLVVDQDDYFMWRANFGSIFAVNADGNGDGTIDAADFIVWRSNLGATLPTAAAASATPSASTLAANVESGGAAVVAMLVTEDVSSTKLPIANWKFAFPPAMDDSASTNLSSAGTSTLSTATTAVGDNLLVLAIGKPDASEKTAGDEITSRKRNHDGSEMSCYAQSLVQDLAIATMFNRFK